MLRTKCIIDDDKANSKINIYIYKDDLYCLIRITLQERLKQNKEVYSIDLINWPHEMYTSFCL